jgi:hypothetical protein
MEAMVRVELHGGTAAEYEELHNYMRSSGFSRTIKGSNGKIYKLPPAEYYYSGSSTGEQVRSLAQAAAKKTGRANAVLVTIATGEILWSGLDQVEPRTLSQSLSGF